MTPRNSPEKKEKTRDAALHQGKKQQVRGTRQPALETDGLRQKRKEKPTSMAGFPGEKHK